MCRPICFETSEALAAFMGALVKADADVKADPSAAQDAVLANLNGVMPREALVALWRDVEIGLELSSGLAELIAEEAAWIVEKGVVNAEAPDAAAVRAAFAPEALAAAAPDAVTLD